MKYPALVFTLLLTACNKQPEPPPPAAKIAEPQRAAMEQAKAVEQTMQQQSEAMQKRLEAETGK